MAARVVSVERDDLVGLGERAVGRVLVARLPVVDVVVGLPFLSSRIAAPPSADACAGS